MQRKNIQIIEEKQLDWLGHAMCMGHEKLTKLVFEWGPGGRKEVGPRKRGYLT